MKTRTLTHDDIPDSYTELLGDRGLGHRILAGERELSKTHIRILAEHFAPNPAVLLR